MWWERRLADVTKKDIEALIANQVRENRELDYKAEAPAHAKADDARGEFIKDVTALANGSGGTLVYGVEEGRDSGQSGVPVRALGLKAFDLDAEVRRLGSILETGVDPRLPSGHVEMHLVPDFENGGVLLIRVRRSWFGPHMIAATGKHRSRFYVRDSSVNKELDALGIRQSVLASASLPEQLRSFRDDRLAILMSSERLLHLYGSARRVLHVVPLAALSGQATLDVKRVGQLAVVKGAHVERGAGGHLGPRYNIDGVLIPGSNFKQEGFSGYTQYFRSGIVESVEAFNVSYREDVYFTDKIEQQIFEETRACVGLLLETGAMPPFAIMVSLVGVRGKHHANQDTQLNRLTGELKYFDRDVIRTPHAVVEAGVIGHDLDEIVRPLLDIIYQAGGVAR